LSYEGYQVQKEFFGLPQILIVEQREERDEKVRRRSGYPAPAAGNPRYWALPIRTPESTSGLTLCSPAGAR